MSADAQSRTLESQECPRPRTCLAHAPTRSAGVRLPGGREPAIVAQTVCLLFRQLAVGKTDRPQVASLRHDPGRPSRNRNGPRAFCPQLRRHWDACEFFRSPFAFGTCLRPARPRSGRRPFWAQHVSSWRRLGELAASLDPPARCGLQGRGLRNGARLLKRRSVALHGCFFCTRTNALAMPRSLPSEGLFMTWP